MAFSYSAEQKDDDWQPSDAALDIDEDDVIEDVGDEDDEWSAYGKPF